MEKKLQLVDKEKVWFEITEFNDRTNVITSFDLSHTYFYSF